MSNTVAFWTESTTESTASHFLKIDSAVFSSACVTSRPGLVFVDGSPLGYPLWIERSTLEPFVSLNQRKISVLPLPL